jgi:hypothetical protein
MRQLFIVLTVLGLGSPAFAQTAAPGTITMIRTGWATDSFAVVLNQTVKNPKGCSTPDGYESEASYPGHSTYLQAALAAYTSTRHVSVTVDNTKCSSSGRPVMMGINIQ